MMKRRDFLGACAFGMGALALRAQERPPAVAGKAKRVIFLFQYGAPSQVDTWDYKPRLKELHGKPVPAEFKKKDKVGGVFKGCHDKLMWTPWEWKRHGGIWASELVRRTAAHADDLCFIRSMVSESSNHAPATYQMNTGVILPGKPSLGSWLTYGLGTENRNLPGYVLLFKVAGLGGSANWSNGFLPAAYQGTPFRAEGDPVLDLRPPAAFAGSQRATLDAVQALNREHRDA